jgi:hexosaminidase
MHNNSHLDVTWDVMYGNEPTAGLSATSDPSLILGGESCMWAETVDPSDLMNTVWPRAAAVAEVQYSTVQYDF